MILTSWNINSVRIRLEIIKRWIEIKNPDVILLQEIKCKNEDFPEEFFSKLGFVNHVFGQKGRNGVATLIKKEFSEKNIVKNLDLTENLDSRITRIYLEDLDIIIYNIYAPNGNPMTDKVKFLNKLTWYKKLRELLKIEIEEEKKIIVGGDFNVIEDENDVNDFTKWINDALGCMQIRKEFRTILGSGMINIIRNFHHPGEKFSFWDYQKASWERNDGLLIDHFLVTPNLIDQVNDFGLNAETRGWERPSDHIPIWLEIN